MKLIIDIPEKEYEEIMYDYKFDPWKLNYYERVIARGEVLDLDKEEAEKNVADLIAEYCSRCAERAL